MADEKKERSIAKGLFTRSRNKLLRAINNKDDAEIVESRLGEFKKRYGDVLEKHEQYVHGIEIVDEPESWVDEIEDEYDEAEREGCRYIKEQQKVEKEVKVDSNAFEGEGIEIQRAKQMRELERSNFMQKVTMINDILKSGKNPEVIMSTVLEAKLDMKAQLERCKIAQSNFVAVISEQDVRQELKWMNDLQERHKEINLSIAEFISKNSNKGDKRPEENAEESTMMKLEKMPLPCFEGEIRNYSSFKDDFQRQVAPRLKTLESEAYVLKSCLKGNPVEIVKNVDDDINQMWKRLDERYGKASILTDVIINDVRMSPPVEDDDEKGFVELVDTVERGYRDLKGAKLEREMSNTSTVSIIEGKLPKMIKQEWSSVINKTGSEVDDKNKFPALLEFLLEQKRIIEYSSAELRNPCSSKNVLACAHLFKKTSVEESATKDRSPIYFKCWLHKTNSHLINFCNEFLAMDPAAKIQLLRERRAQIC